jgi:hypothetical protein
MRVEQRLRKFENKMLGRILGTKRREESASWKKDHISFSSSNLTTHIKLRRLKWAANVERMG